MPILCLETSGTNCSVAIVKDNVVIASKEENTKNFSHAEKLHVFIKDTILAANLSFTDIKAVAVSMGPGSYTGLRIGVSAAKGLCFAWGIPLIAVPTLAVLANQAQEQGAKYIIPLLDARRMEVYTAVFTTEQHCIAETSALVFEEENPFLEYLEKGKVVFIGDGVAKSKAILQHPNAVFVEDQYPSAISLAALATVKYNQKAFEDVAYFEPFYLKDFKVTPKKN